MMHLAFAPARAMSDATLTTFKNPFNPFAHTSVGRSVAAAAELFERMTRRYGKPVFGLPETLIDGVATPIIEEVVWERPFCRLLHFRRAFQGVAPRQSKLLIVAPMSGHYATLLRGTVEAFLPSHDVYITDWCDARAVPAEKGVFGLDHYVDYLVDALRLLSKRDDGVRCIRSAFVRRRCPIICAIAALGRRGAASTRPNPWC